MRTQRTLSLAWLWALACVASLAQALAASSIVSSMPASTLSGVSIVVTNLATPGAEVIVYAVEDLLPPGWTADQISHGGRFDAITRKVKWGLFFDHTPRELTFRATSPNAASGPADFAGIGLFDSTVIPISGARSCTVVSSAGASRVEAALPSYYRAGHPFTLSESAEPSLNTKSYAIEETLPAGWTASVISHGGQFDPGNRKLKWGPFSDATPRALTAQILPPANATNPATFVGIASFDGVTIPIIGQREILPETNSVISVLPEFFRPGQSFTVTLTATPVADALSYAVAETVPAGWSVSSISSPGILDADARTIRWGPFFDDAPRTLTYVATAPASAAGSYTFAGNGSFDGSSVAISGRRITTAFASTAVRVLPPEVTPGAPFDVSYHVTPAVGVLSQALEDEIPPGWSVAAISHGGQFDAGDRKIRWGPFADETPRVLTCQITPPAEAAGTGYFFGAGSFDGLSVAITGDTHVRIVTVEAANQLTRLMPATVVAGNSFIVRLNVTVAPTVRDYAVEDLAPAGWTVSEISDGGTFDALNQKVKWGPFADNISRVVSYRIAAPTNSSGPYPFFATASFDGVSIFEEGMIIVFQPITPPNDPPAANNVTYIRAPNLTLKIRIADLLANHTTDPENDPRSLKSLGASGQGATITVGGPFILYAPVNNNNDSFTYTIADAMGRTATGRIIVEVVNAFSRATSITSSGNAVTIRFVGIPNFQYEVQRSGFPIGPWTTIQTLTAGTDGTFGYTETPPFSPAFYRLYQP